MFLAKAIQNLQPNASFIIENETYETIIWRSEDIVIPAKKEVMVEVERLKNLQPMLLLRLERNKRLTETDWRATVDYPKTDKQLWLDYRQALRDLPETAEPKLENEMLTNVTWPEVPE